MSITAPYGSFRRYTKPREVMNSPRTRFQPWRWDLGLGNPYGVGGLRYRISSVTGLGVVGSREMKGVDFMLKLQGSFPAHAKTQSMSGTATSRGLPPPSLLKQSGFSFLFCPSSGQLVAFIEDHCPQRETPCTRLERWGVIQIPRNHGYRFRCQAFMASWPDTACLSRGARLGLVINIWKSSDSRQ